jgi:hypothetical protein
MQGDKTRKGRWCLAFAKFSQPTWLNYGRRTAAMATPAATRMDQAATHQPTLFLAFELGASTWKLGFTTGTAQRLRERRMPAAAVHVLHEEIPQAKQRFGLPEDAHVVS